MPVLPAIDPGLAGTALDGVLGGTLLWIGFGLIGSLRVLPIPGSGGAWTFHFPFIAAAMVLGGPAAGGWVGFLSTFERRELESSPWYGVLANHAVMALAASIGGLTVQLLGRGVAALGVDPGAANLAGVAVGTLLLAVVSNGIGAGTIILREGLPAMSLVEILIRSFGRITVGEIGLAWVFVTAYVDVGWWAPLAVALLILIVWPGEGVEFQDPLMRLPRMRAFERQLDGLLARTRRGLAGGGLLLSIDLDGFGQVNKSLGKGAGDEVLAEIGERLRALVRSTDLVARLGGDELAVFFTGVGDLPTARRLAARVEAAIRKPIQTSAGTLRIGVSIGAVIVRPASDIPARRILMHWADREMQAQKDLQRAGQTRSGIRFHPYGMPPERAVAGPAGE